MATQSEHQKNWYEKNKARHIANVRANNNRVVAENRARLQALKGSTPCTDCGVTYPYYVMDFDHTGNDKAANVADLVALAYTWTRIQKEMDKCELVCANCHRERTHVRRTSLASIDGDALDS